VAAKSLFRRRRGSIWAIVWVLESANVLQVHYR
jgi:hypothetical protein